MHSKNDNIEITINDKTEEVMKSMVQERILKNAYPFQLQQKKKLQKLVKMEKKLQKSSYRLQVIDNARFLTSLLLSLFNNFIEGIHRIKCKYGHDNKKYET